MIRGDTPPVFPSLTVQGTLTLTGANLYSGRTSIGDGVNPGSGKLAVANATGSATGSGDVSIQRGGTLAGSGITQYRVADTGPYDVHGFAGRNTPAGRAARAQIVDFVRSIWNDGEAKITVPTGCPSGRCDFSGTP